MEAASVLFVELVPLDGETAPLVIATRGPVWRRQAPTGAPTGKGCESVWLLGRDGPRLRHRKALQDAGRFNEDAARVIFACTLANTLLAWTDGTETHQPQKRSVLRLGSLTPDYLP